ncbi:MAG: ATP-binding cassette domain-containing protein, partial [Candidatus Korarchaeota archaeon]|nr:ATP-binding cassette domain-containing protein [Candidatus Korarchaeota archaeon]
MIEVRGLSVDLGEFKLRDIDLVVEDGEYLVVMGPSGAGKTVLLQTILGIVRPIGGRIVVDDVDVTDFPPERRGLS